MKSVARSLFQPEIQFNYYSSSNPIDILPQFAYLINISTLNRYSPHYWSIRLPSILYIIFCWESFGNAIPSIYVEVPFQLLGSSLPPTWNCNFRYQQNRTFRAVIAARALPYKCGTRHCDLCLSEKTIIARLRPNGMVNKRSEIVSKCRHRSKFKLNSVV